MVNQKTDHLQLPLPSPDNLLSDDVQRLRGALVQIDQNAAQNHAQFETVTADIADGARVTRKLNLRRLLQLDF